MQERKQQRERKRPPFFEKGKLAFLKSGHTLTHGKYYGCGKKKKGKKKELCNFDEKTIKVESLERNFARFVMREFEIQGPEKWPVLKKVMGMILHDHVDDMLNDPDTPGVFFDEAMTDAKRNLESGNMKEFRDDVKNADYALGETIEKDTSLLGGILLGMVIMLAKENMSEMEVGRSFAWLSEKVYLSNTCKIEKIKMGPAGDFVLQYMEKNIPGYSAPSKWLTERRSFPSLNYKEIASMIRVGQTRVDLPSLSIGTFLAPYSKRVISNLPRMTPKDIFKILPRTQ